MDYVIISFFKKRKKDGGIRKLLDRQSQSHVLNEIFSWRNFGTQVKACVCLNYSVNVPRAQEIKGYMAFVLSCQLFFLCCSVPLNEGIYWQIITT